MSAAPQQPPPPGEYVPTADQRIVRTTLAELPTANITNPAIIVIGEVVLVGDKLQSVLCAAAGTVR